MRLDAGDGRRARFPPPDQRGHNHGARTERDERHRVTHEIESASQRRHQNLLAVHRPERGENFRTGVSTGDQTHHVSVHRGRNAAREIGRAARIDVEVASTLAMDVVLELVALRIRHRRLCAGLGGQRHRPIDIVRVRHRTVERLHRHLRGADSPRKCRGREADRGDRENELAARNVHASVHCTASWTQ